MREFASPLKKVHAGLGHIVGEPIFGDIMATRLKIAIVERDLTQGKLAELVGISETALSAIVRGKSEPTLRTARKIAKVLDKTIDELWPEED